MIRTGVYEITNTNNLTSWGKLNIYQNLMKLIFFFFYDDDDDDVEAGVIFPKTVIISQIFSVIPQVLLTLCTPKD